MKTIALFLIATLITVSGYSQIRYAYKPQPLRFRTIKIDSLPLSNGGTSSDSVVVISSTGVLKKRNPSSFAGATIDTAIGLSTYVQGVGSSGYIPRFNSTRKVVNSVMYQFANGNIGINTLLDSVYKLNLRGNVWVFADPDGALRVTGSGTLANLVSSSTDLPFMLFDKAGVISTAFGMYDANGNLGISNTQLISGLKTHRFFADGKLNSIGSVGFGGVDIDSSAVLTLTSTTKGFLGPRMTTTQRNAISSPAVSLMIYNTTDSVYQYYRLSGWTNIGTGGVGSGVTSVATNTATGITGGPITTTGTISADTLLLGTRLWRQKGIDSVQGNITSGLAGKLNLSDTASMLTGYTRVQRLLDSLSNHTTRFNGVTSSLALKVNISDTASMLSGYTRVQRFLDSLTNHTTRFNGVTSSLASKLNLSDTSGMLTNYIRRQELKDTAAAIRSAIGSGGGANNYPTGVTYTQSSRTLAIQRNGLSDISTTLPTATSSLAGLMSAADKARLDSNFYIRNILRTGYDTLSRKMNDTTLALKGIKFTNGSNFTFTVNRTDTTIEVVGDATAGGSLSDGDKGDITVTSGVWTIDNAAVTLAKMANIASGKVIGRTSAGSGVPEEVTAAVINLTTPATGDHLEYNSSTSEWENKASMVLTKVNINGATQDTATAEDMVPFYEATSGTNRKMTVEQLMERYVREYRRAHGFDYINEFINTPTTTSNGNDLLATNSGTSAATSTQATDASNRIGLVRTTTGTTATGRSYVNAAASTVRLGGGTWVYEQSINITTASNGTERFQSLFGFFDTYTAANQVDGVYLLYDEGGVSTGSTASANWQLVTSSNSTRTFSTSSTAVATGSWVTLRVEINAAASRADFFVNGTNIGNITTNIPTASGRELGFGWGMIKSVGTTARTMDTDYIMVQNEYTTTK